MSSGINALSNGLDKYNKEGIKKISKLVNGDVKTLQKRLDALVKLSKDNKTVDKIPNKSKSSSKIIFMIDSKEMPKRTKTETKKIEKKDSFWDKVKGLFK